MTPVSHRILSLDKGPAARSGWAAILFVALGLAPAWPEERSGAVPPVATLDIVARLDGLASRDLWPGFDPSRVPLAIWDGTRTLLFHHPSPPQEFARFDSLRGIWSFDGLRNEVRANSAVELGGVKTATVMLRHPGSAAPESMAARAALLAHETFHVFQRQHHSAWIANEASLFTYPLEDDSCLCWRRLESEALSRAVAAKSDAQASRWAATALQMRRQRFARLPEDAVAYERGSELNEGLAQYVQDRALAFLLDISPAAIAARHATRLHADFEPAALRPRAYVTGAALGALLDRFEPQWRAQLEGGEKRPLEALLEAAVARSAVAPTTFDARTQQAAMRRARADVQAIAARRQKLQHDFLSRPGGKLVFEAAGNEPFWPQGFDPLNVEALRGGAVLHTRWFTISNGSGKLEVMDRASLSEPAGAHPLFQGIRKLTISGLETAPEVQQTDSTLVVRATGVDAKFRHGRVERIGGTVVVHVTD